jgi:hypothetical protein
MPLRIAQATNAEAIWNEMQAEYHTFLNDPKEPWKRQEFQYKRPSNTQLEKFKALSMLKVWINHASEDHYFVYLIGPTDTGGQIKVLAGNLIRSGGG